MRCSGAAAARHDRKVARIVDGLRAHDPARPISLKKRAVSHQVPKPHDLRARDSKIDVTDLTEILHIDPVARTCVAESGVTFVDLVRATLRYGLIPKVVPELKTITIGGAVSGCSIESTSFRYGGFHDTCRAYEVITAEGEILHCTPDNEHQLVFQMIHGSFGTLGILSQLEFELMPAGRYVELAYEHYSSVPDYQNAIARHAEAGDLDFMDGIIHSPTHYALCTGTFVDHAPYVHRYDWLAVYYKTTANRVQDFMRTADYLFRYDRGVTNVQPRSFLGRLLFGKLMTSTRWLELAHAMPWLLRTDRPTITLDVFVPMSKLPALLAWCDRELGFYPLWCVPYRRVRDYEWLDDSFYAGLADQLFIDIAIYGMRPPAGRNYYRAIEHQLRELGGVKTLISHNFYEEEEFWSIWNRRNYNTVKALTDPRNRLRDLYTKTCKTAMGIAEQPFPGPREYG
jgi:FAD/FMN-containing dehydrogenase